MKSCLRASLQGISQGVQGRTAPLQGCLLLKLNSSRLSSLPFQVVLLQPFKAAKALSVLQVSGCKIVCVERKNTQCSTATSQEKRVSSCKLPWQALPFSRTSNRSAVVGTMAPFLTDETTALLGQEAFLGCRQL